MSTPTNWPDPKRPGVPLFPERDGWHAIGLTIKQVKWWDAANKYWWDFERRYYLTLDEVAFRVPGYGYIGPVLTPAQINEMLAAERERCAKKAQEISDGYYEQRETAGSDAERIYADERMCAAKECADYIRNLGAAP